MIKCYFGAFPHSLKILSNGIFKLTSHPHLPIQEDLSTFLSDTKNHWSISKDHLFLKVHLSIHNKNLPFSSLRPSWPNLLRPHPKIAPERVSTKLWAPPAATCMKGIPSKDLIRCGEPCFLQSMPKPNWPYLFCPQQKTSLAIKQKS